MKYVKTIVNSTYELKGCWLFEEKRYFFEGRHEFQLPILSLRYKEVLETLGIPYKLVIDYYNEQVLMYWDAEYEEYEEKTGPLYYKYSYGVYKYTGKNYSAKLPSEKMIQMARLEQLTVEKAIFSYENYKNCQKFLDGNAACFFASHNGADFSSTWNGAEIKQFSFIIHTSFGNRYGIVLFDMNYIKSNNYNTVTLHLSEDNKKYAGLIIGKGGCRVKEWSKELGLKKIIIE